MTTSPKPLGTHDYDAPLTAGRLDDIGADLAMLRDATDPKWLPVLHGHAERLYAELCRLRAAQAEAGAGAR